MKSQSTDIRSIFEKLTEPLFARIETQEEIIMSLVARIENLTTMTHNVSDKVKTLTTSVENSVLEKSDLFNDLMGKVSSFADASERVAKKCTKTVPKGKQKKK